METLQLFDELRKLLKSRSQKYFQIAETNFRIGKVLSEAQSGSHDVQAIAKVLTQGGLSVKETFLYDCVRVFRTLKTEQMLKGLRDKLNGRLTWGFLVCNCTKAPAGDSDEAVAYWEERLGRIENALNDLDDVADMYEFLPEAVRRQIEGLAIGVGNSLCGGDGRKVLEGPVKIGHLADLHVSETMPSGGKIVIDPQMGMNERLLDMHRCISFAVDRMIEEKCRVALVTEPTETHQPTPNEERYLLSSILRLTENGIPVIVEPGNHGISKNPKDSSALAFLQGRPNVFVVEKPTVLYLEGNELRETPSEDWPQADCAKIFVLPFPSRSILNGKAEGLSIEEQNKAASAALRTIVASFKGEIDGKVPNILLAHLTIIGSTGAENPEMTKYDPYLYPEDLEGFSYVALGHIHIHQMVAPNAYYAGSIDRNDFNEEGDEKGFIIASFEGRTPKVEFIRTPAREFRTITTDFFDDPDWEDKVDPGTIYRIKGEVSKEAREALRPFINRFMEITPLLYKLTVKREMRVRDEKMTEDLREEEAMRRYLARKGYDEDFINLCLQTFNESVGEQARKQIDESIAKGEEEHETFALEAK
jgi:DNA repair exonuclease SbcCD nuclease subunit